MDTVVCAWAIRWHSSSPCLPHLLLLLLRLPPGSSRRSSSSSSTASLSTWRLAESVVDTVVGMDMMYMAHGYCNGLRRNGLRRNGLRRMDRRNGYSTMDTMDTAQQMVTVQWIRCNGYSGYAAMDYGAGHMDMDTAHGYYCNGSRRNGHGAWIGAMDTA